MKNQISNVIPVLHPTQLKILKSFRSKSENTFNQMKSFKIDPKNFVYHLNKLLENKILYYDRESGLYKITDFGKLYFMHFKKGLTIDRMTVNTFVGLYIKHKNKILVVKRKKNPYLNHVGIPVSGTSINTFLEDSAKILLFEIGLEEEPKRSLIIETIYLNKDEIALTHSNMHVFSVKTDDVSNIQKQIDEGELFWMTEKQLLSQEKGYKDSESIIEYFKNKKDGIGYITRIDSETGI